MPCLLGLYKRYYKHALAVGKFKCDLAVFIKLNYFGRAVKALAAQTLDGAIQRLKAALGNKNK